VNYSTKDSCIAAQARFHSQYFHGSKLVCGLRESSTGISAKETSETQIAEKQNLTETLKNERFRNEIIQVSRIGLWGKVLELKISAVWTILDMSAVLS
jgi:hypothetical protein